MKKIGIEEHFMTRDFAKYLKDNFGPGKKTPGVTSADQVEIGGIIDMFSHSLGMARTPLDMLLDVGKQRLADMDSAGVTMQVLSLVPGVMMLGEKDAITQARKINDELSAIVHAHPDRFAGLATLPLQSPKDAADELARSVNKLGLKGAMVFSNVKGEYLDEKKFWPVLEMAARLDVPLYNHPRPPSPDMIKPYTTYPELTGAVWGYSAEAGLQAMRLICSGVFDEFPNLKIILGHMGEALPYWLWRMDKGWSSMPAGKRRKKSPSGYVKSNFYVTTSGMFWTPALLCAYLGLGADRIVFAVDYPFESITDATAFIDSIPVSDVDKEKICHRNLEELLKL